MKENTTEYAEEFDIIPSGLKEKLDELIVALTGTNDSNMYEIDFYEEMNNGNPICTSSYKIMEDGNLQLQTRSFDENGQLIKDIPQKGKKHVVNY